MKYKTERMLNFLTSFIMWWVYGGIAGVLSLLFMGDNHSGKVVLLAEYFLHEFDVKTIQYNGLLSVIFWTRFPVLLVVLISVNFASTKKVGNIVAGIYGFTMTYLLYVLSASYHLKGFALCVLLWMPHMALYLISIYNLSREKASSWREKMLLGCLYFAGMLSEAYINPTLIHSFARFL